MSDNNGFEIEFNNLVNKIVYSSFDPLFLPSIHINSENDLKTKNKYQEEFCSIITQYQIENELKKGRNDFIEGYIDIVKNWPSNEDKSDIELNLLEIDRHYGISSSQNQINDLKTVQSCTISPNKAAIVDNNEKCGLSLYRGSRSKNSQINNQKLFK